MSDKDVPRFGWHVGRRARKAWPEGGAGRRGPKNRSEATEDSILGAVKRRPELVVLTDGETRKWRAVACGVFVPRFSASLVNSETRVSFAYVPQTTQNLHRTAPPDVRTKRPRATVLAVSSRPVTGHVLVTREQRLQIIKEEARLGGLTSHDSLKLAANTRRCPEGPHLLCP